MNQNMSKVLTQGRGHGRTYESIKAALAEAGRMVDAGDVAGADDVIRSMLGKGLTGADLDANLTSEQVGKLRAYEKAVELDAKKRGQLAAAKKRGGAPRWSRTESSRERDEWTLDVEGLAVDLTRERPSRYRFNGKGQAVDMDGTPTWRVEVFDSEGESVACAQWVEHMNARDAQRWAAKVFAKWLDGKVDEVEQQAEPEQASERLAQENAMWARQQQGRTTMNLREKLHYLREMLSDDAKQRVNGAIECINAGVPLVSIQIPPMHALGLTDADGEPTPFGQFVCDTQRVGGGGL
jgi:hypothetical protein